MNLTNGMPSYGSLLGSTSIGEVPLNARFLRIAFALLVLLWPQNAARSDGELPPLEELQITSSIDGTMQPSRLWAPALAKSRPTPLLIWLHSWSFDYRQKDSLAYQQQAVRRGWILLLPNFRGRNDNPQAGGSKLARADVIDALDYVLANYDVDPYRIYLAGGSGGGHMALLMAGYHPHRFSAVSSWVPITDLADWFTFHSRPGGAERYAKGVVAVCGGPPGTSAAVDAEYSARSPINLLDQTGTLPIDIVAGIRDTAVPIIHSLNAFNRIALARGDKQISSPEVEQLLVKGKLEQPRDSDRVTDESYGCDIILRRHAGPARVTIFQGGHIAIPEACCHWLSEQHRSTKQ
jgi:poly(3-hydroxybutyrate) depolymerase